VRELDEVDAVGARRDDPDLGEDAEAGRVEGILEDGEVRPGPSTIRLSVNATVMLPSFPSETTSSEPALNPRP
jgi:hypothetical protein